MHQTPWTLWPSKRNLAPITITSYVNIECAGKWPLSEKHHVYPHPQKGVLPLRWVSFLPAATRQETTNAQEFFILKGSWSITGSNLGVFVIRYGRMAHERVPNRVRFVCANFREKHEEKYGGDEREGVVDFLEISYLFTYYMYMWHVITYVIMNCNLVILTSGYMEREVVVKHSIRCKKLIKRTKTIWQILEHLNVSLKTWNLLNLCLSLSLYIYVYIYIHMYTMFLFWRTDLPSWKWQNCQSVLCEPKKNLHFRWSQ